MTKIIVKYLLVVAAVFQPVMPIIYVILVFILFDLLTALYAKVIKKKEKLQSNKLRKTTEKFVYYTLAILLAHLFDVYLMNIFLTKAVAGFIAVTELLSIYENITLITGTDIAKKLLGQIKFYFKDLSVNSNNKKKKRKTKKQKL